MSIYTLRCDETTSNTAALYIVRYNSVDVCVAVATDGGLITPIVPKAETKVSNIRVYIPSGFARKLFHKKHLLVHTEMHLRSKF